LDIALGASAVEAGSYAQELCANSGGYLCDSGATYADPTGTLIQDTLVGLAAGGLAKGFIDLLTNDLTEVGTADLLGQLATKAATSVGPGSGPVYGTAVHTAFKAEIEALGNANLETEVSYLNGQVESYGTRGSIRADVVEGGKETPSAIYDLKTGGASLTQARISQILSQLPPGYQDIPVIEIRS
jgi:hypothetical protein